MTVRMIRLLVVAPFTGAWIEIATCSTPFWLPQVAPFTGAWIEMATCACLTPDTVSLPSRERGLKYRRADPGRGSSMSLPSRERGLKYDGGGMMSSSILSLPSRERGLKCERGIGRCDGVASLPSRERGLKSLGVLRFATQGGRSLHGSVD